MSDEPYTGKIAVSISYHYDTDDPVIKLYSNPEAVIGQRLETVLNDVLDNAPADLNDPELVKMTKERINEAFDLVRNSDNGRYYLIIEINKNIKIMVEGTDDLLKYIITENDLINSRIESIDCDYKSLKLNFIEPVNS